MSDGEQFSCSACGASFRRAEHLRRHHSSHSTSRPFNCDYCESSFKRRDVLRKHLKKCSGRIERDLAMPGRLAVGKKATACDQCAHSKRACDSKVPCSTCAGRKHICTYERQLSSSKQTDQKTEAVSNHFDDSDRGSDFNYDFLEGVSSTRNLSFQVPTEEELLHWDWDMTLTPPLSDGSAHQTQGEDIQPDSGFSQLQSNDLTAIAQGNSGRPGPFDFLLNFTHSSGIQSVFNYKRQRYRTAQEEGQNATQFYKSNPDNPNSTFNSLFSKTSFTNARSSRHDQENVRVSLMSFIDYLDDPLFAQTKAIWDCFRVSRMRSSQSILLSTEEAEASDEGCLHFFSPSNLRRFIELFWDEWYPHCPIIHKPSFDILSTPSVLLVPMIVMGACMSPISREVALAKQWLDFAEELVFSSSILSAEAIERDVLENDVAPLRIVQAAYITCILLNWEGSDTMKRRVRHDRFAAVVSCAREIGLSSANHFPIDHVNACNFDWYAFIQREECIRTFTYVFLLDTAFVIFNNTPPRMVLHEMDLEMTTSEACFQAVDATTCYSHWHTYVSNQFTSPVMNPLLLAEAISLLMQEKFEDHSLRFLNMNTLNLFTLVAGLHTILFQQKSLLTCLPTTLLPLKNALMRWQSAWAVRSDIDQVVERESWKDTGFIGQAQEFAWLFLARLNSLESPAQAVSSTDGRNAKPATGRLDDTSMSVVTDLMLSLTVKEQ